MIPSRGAPKGRARGPGPSSWDLKCIRFSWFLPLNYVVCIFATRVLNFLLCGRIQEARALLATIHENFCSGPPLEKILGAPLIPGIP